MLCEIEENRVQNLTNLVNKDKHRHKDKGGGHAPACAPPLVPLLVGGYSDSARFYGFYPENFEKFKTGPVFMDFPANKSYPCLGLLCKKVTRLSGTSPYTAHM